MLLPRYKFYVGPIEVHPIYNKLSKKYEKESNEHFFREKIDGTIKLIGQDFALVESASIEQDLTFSINKLGLSDNSYKTYYRGRFNKMDCTFNYDTKTCTFKLKEFDRYSAFMDNYENTIDLLKYGVRPTQINIAKRGLIQVYLTNSSVLTNFLGGGIYWEQSCEAIGDPKELINKYHFKQDCVIQNIDLRTPNLFPFNKTSYLGYGYYTYDEAPWYEGAKIDYEFRCYAANDPGSYLKIRTNAYSGAILKDENMGLFSKSDNSQTYKVTSISDDLSDLPAAMRSKYINKATLKAINSEAILYIYASPIEHVYTRLLCDVTSINGVNTYPIPADDIIENNSNYKYVIGYDFREIVPSSRFTSSVTPYGNNAEGNFYLPPASVYGDKYFPVNRSMWYDEYSIWFKFGPLYSTVEASARKVYTLRDGYFIADVIKTMLSKTAPGITHEATTEYSQFLYAASNPLAGLSKFYLFLAPKSNILKGEYDRAAQKAELTFKELMEMLWNCFRLRWFIDDQNRLRIEHISWFLNGESYSSTARQVQIDLTKDKDNKNLRALSSFQNEISYDKTELAGRFEFSWMDDCTEVFEGTPINIISKYVEASKIENITASKFTPDVDYMLAEPTAFSQDGFALLCATKNSNDEYELPFITFSLKGPLENDVPYQAVVQNGLASWLHLVKYYMYDMPGANLEYDYLDEVLQVKAVKRSMQQKIEFPREADPSVYGLIKTERGEGVIDSMSINMVNMQVSTTLSFKPA